jgi:hypothetical protein
MRPPGQPILPGEGSSGRHPASSAPKGSAAPSRGRRVCAWWRACPRPEATAFDRDGRRRDSRSMSKRVDRQGMLGPFGRDWAADDPSAAGQHLRVAGGRSEWAVRRPRLCLSHGPAGPRDVRYRRPRQVPKRSPPELYDHDHRPVDNSTRGRRPTLTRAPCPAAIATIARKRRLRCSTPGLRRLPVPTRPSTAVHRVARGNDDRPRLHAGESVVESVRSGLDDAEERYTARRSPRRA